MPHKRMNPRFLKTAYCLGRCPTGSVTMGWVLCDNGLGALSAEGAHKLVCLSKSCSETSYEAHGEVVELFTNSLSGSQFETWKKFLLTGLHFCAPIVGCLGKDFSCNCVHT